MTTPYASPVRGWGDTFDCPNRNESGRRHGRNIIEYVVPEAKVQVYVGDDTTSVGPKRVLKRAHHAPALTL